MTWVIGTSGLGYAMTVSDVQVTWKTTNNTLDCLQKVYPIGRYMAAGFAGSVKLGLKMIGDLQSYLHIPPNQEGCWVPGITFNTWRRQARRLFLQEPKTIQDLGCDLLIASVFWMEEWGESPFPKTTVGIMRSPEFIPEWAKYKDCASIGSGNRIEEYRKHLAGIAKEPMNLWQMEVGMPGGAAGMLGFTTGQLVEAHPTAGISSHMHICQVRWNSIEISTNDWTTVDPQGRRTEHKMPPVAKNWKEFEFFCQEKGLSEAEAFC